MEMPSGPRGPWLGPLARADDRLGLDWHRGMTFLAHDLVRHRVCVDREAVVMAHGADTLGAEAGLEAHDLRHLSVAVLFHHVEAPILARKRRDLGRERQRLEQQ